MIILHKYTVILPRSKKMHNIPLLSSEFLWLKCIQFLLKPEKYHLWLTVRNYHGQQEIVQRYTTISKFFGNKEFHFLKANISGKSKIFQGERDSFLVILFNRTSKFWVWIPPTCPEIQALKGIAAYHFYDYLTKHQACYYCANHLWTIRLMELHQ